jgi:hypothetical protein
MSTTPPAGRKQVKIGTHLVLYVDLLGQSTALEGLRKIPETEEEEAAMEVAVNESARLVLQVRRNFENFIAAVNKIDPAVLETWKRNLSERRRHSTRRLWPQRR